MAGYIDLHLHYVPGVDDGVRTREEALALCRGLKALGFERLVTTPHIRSGMFDNSRGELVRAFEAFVDSASVEPGMPELGIAAEHHYDDNFLALFRASELLPYPGDRALLIEFPNETLPVGFDQVAFKLRLKGLAPVIAHPERYLPLFRRSDAIERLLEQDVYFQLDLMALVGKYGRSARAAAERMLDEGVYAIAASDAHRLEDLPRTAEALERLQELVGSDEAEILLAQNPRRLLSGQALL